MFFERDIELRNTTQFSCEQGSGSNGREYWAKCRLCVSEKENWDCGLYAASKRYAKFFERKVHGMWGLSMVSGVRTLFFEGVCGSMGHIKPLDYPWSSSWVYRP